MPVTIVAALSILDVHGGPSMSLESNEDCESLVFVFERRCCLLHFYYWLCANKHYPPSFLPCPFLLSSVNFIPSNLATIFHLDPTSSNIRSRLRPFYVLFNFRSMWLWTKIQVEIVVILIAFCIKELMKKWICIVKISEDRKSLVHLLWIFRVQVVSG